MDPTHQVTESRPLGAEPGQPRRSKPFATLGQVGCLLLAIFAVLGIIVPRGLPPRVQGKLTGCKSNLRNMATALEMYAEDHKGHYPHRLEELIPGNYLRAIPTCPAAGQATYTDYQLIQTSDGEEFKLSCVGDHHRKSYEAYANPSVNFPRYYSRTGLIDHP